MISKIPWIINLKGQKLTIQEVYLQLHKKLFYRYFQKNDETTTTFFLQKIGAPSGRLISDTDLLLGAELFREQLAAQAERQNERQRLRGDLFGGGFPDYNNLDTDILYRL